MFETLPNVAMGDKPEGEQKSEMKTIRTTKKIVLCGTSLTVNLTPECRALDLERGDYVDIIIRPHKDH